MCIEAWRAGLQEGLRAQEMAAMRSQLEARAADVATGADDMGVVWQPALNAGDLLIYADALARAVVRALTEPDLGAKLTPPATRRRRLRNYRGHRSGIAEPLTEPNKCNNIQLEFFEMLSIRVKLKHVGYNDLYDINLRASA